MATTAKWHRLASLDENLAIRCVAVINEGEYIVITHVGIHSYNTTKDKWSELIKFSKETTNIPDFTHRTLDYASAAYDNKSNIVYIFNSQALLEINMNTNKITSHESHDGSDGDFSSLTVIDSKLHIIGGYEHNEHIIWDGNSKKYSKIGDICDENIDAKFYLVHSESNKILMRLHNLNMNEQHFCNYSASNDTFKWNKRSIFNSFLAEIRSGDVIENTPYMIIFDHCRNGYIVDINTWKVYKSKHTAPKASGANYHVLGLDVDETKKIKIAQGYNRMNFASAESEQFPFDLIRLIAMYYSKIDLYFIGYCHHKMPLDLFVNNMEYLGLFWNEE